MYIELDERRLANAAEAMDLPGLDDENVTGARFEFLSVDGPEAPAFPDELDFIVRMTMGPWATSGEGAEEEDGDIDVPVFGSNELVRAALKWQVLLTDTIHRTDAPQFKRLGLEAAPTDVPRRARLPPGRLA
jgi:hypothetical protein